MPWPINRRNSLPCTVRTSQTKVVQSKGWLSDGCLITLQLNMESIFKGDVERTCTRSVTTSHQNHHTLLYEHLAVAVLRQYLRETLIHSSPGKLRASYTSLPHPLPHFLANFRRVKIFIYDHLKCGKISYDDLCDLTTN